MLDAEQITPEAVEDAEREEKLAEADFARLVDNPAAEQPSDAEKPEEQPAEAPAQPVESETPAEEPAEQETALAEEAEQTGDQSESV